MRGRSGLVWRVTPDASSAAATMLLNAEPFGGMAVANKDRSLAWNGCLFLSVIAAVFAVPFLVFAGFVVWALIYRGLGYVPPELQ